MYSRLEQMFRKWLRELCSHPIKHGIPSKYTEDVCNILEALSGINQPITAESIQNIVSIFMAFNNDGSHVLKPVVVHFGPQDTELQITDGASALGYLFSIVSPPPDVDLTWSGYFMPLLVLFSKCLFLLFAVEDDNTIMAISGVPIMANVMYLPADVPRGGQMPPFFFGATIPATPHLSAKDPTFKTARGMVCTWRRDELLVPALEDCEQSHLGQQQSIPLLDPTLRQTLANRLDGLIRGVPQINAHEIVRLPLAPDLYELPTRVTQTVLNRTSPDFTAVAFDQLLLDDYTRHSLLKLLEKVINLGYSQTHHRQDPTVTIAFRELLWFYVAPHVFPVATNQIPLPTEIALDADENFAVNDIVATLWTSCSNRALEKLRYLREMQEKYEDPTARTVFGRCAETYPIVAIQ
ncbi:Nn.00g018170.m01.CDS01 [Neocucurbitaria sp. VM-36]